MFQHRTLYLYLLILSLPLILRLPSPVVAQEHVTLNPVADTFVDSGYPDSNFGGQVHLRVGDTQGVVILPLPPVSQGPGLNYAYLKFDLSSIPKDAKIAGASLHLYSFLVPETYKIGVYYVADNTWTENTITWNNRPPFDNSSSVVATVSKPMEWTSWQIGDMVQKALPSGALSITLKAQGRYQSSFVVFFSKDQVMGVFQENLPKLVVLWTVPDNVPPTISNVKHEPASPSSDDSVKVTATILDDKSGVGAVFLQYSIDNGATWTRVTMSPTSGALYQGVIPKQKDWTKVIFYIEACDKANNIAKSDTMVYDVKMPLMTMVLIALAIVAVVMAIIALPIIRALRRRVA